MKASRYFVALGILVALTSPLSAASVTAEELDYQLERQLEDIRTQFRSLEIEARSVGRANMLAEISADLEKAEIWHDALERGLAIRTDAQIHSFLYSIRTEVAKAEAALGIRRAPRPAAPTAATIAGTVTGSDLPAPSGLAGVWVEFFDTSNAWVDAVQTDSNGDYVSSSLSAGTYFAKTLNFSAYVDELYDDIPCHNICDIAGEGDSITVDGAPITDIDFDLDPGGTISGTITDVDGGAPLEGVIVDLFDTSGDWVSNTGSGADGTYVSLGLPAGQYYLRTHNEDRYLNELYNNIACPFRCDPVSSGGDLVEVTVGSDNGGKDFALAKGGWISGNVAESGAAAISGVIVEIFDSSGLWAGWGETDGSGNYSSNTGLPTGNYFAKTLATSPYLDELYDGFPCHSWCEITGGTEIAVVEGVEKTGIDFLLDQGGMISGTVTDANTTAGIVGVWVEFFDGAGVHVGSALSETGGIYTSFPLPVGTYYSSTWNDLNYVNELFQETPCPFGCDRTLGTTIPVIANSTVLFIDFTLDFGATISGTVTQNDGTTGIENVFVELHDSAGDALFGTSTDSSGDYTLSGLPPGDYYVKTRNDLGYLDEVYDNFPCPNWCDVTDGTTLTATSGLFILGVDFVLNQGGLVTGTVTEDPSGLPIEGIFVDIFDATGKHVSNGPTDANGEFVSFYALVPGTHYAKTFNDLGYINEIYDDITCLSCDVTQGTSFEVVAGSTTTGIDFALEGGGRISGTVTEMGTGTPIANVHVDIFDTNGDFVTFGPSDANGDYTAYDALPPGDYYARAWAESVPHLGELYDNIPCHFSCDVTTGTPITVAAGSSTDIDFELTAGGLISGTVTQVGGAALEGVHVNVYNSAGVHLTWEATDASGNYTTTLALPPGTYFVATSTFAGVIHEVYNDQICLNCDPTTLGDPVGVTSNSTTTGIDFELAQGGTIAGTLTDSVTGLGIPRVRVVVHDANGVNIQNFLPDGNGDYVTPSALPTGNYFVRTATMWGTSPRYINELYDGGACIRECDVTTGTPVAVIEGSMTGDIDFELVIGGLISGTVLDSTSGLGIGDSEVMLYDSGGHLVSISSVDTAGAYTSFDGVPTGTYYASTANGAGYFDELYSETICQGGADFCNVTAGTPIAITAGVTTPNIDFTLSQGGGWFAGSVTDAVFGHSLAGASVSIYNASGVEVTRVSWPRPRPQDGSFKTCGLPAGTYYAMADSEAWNQNYAEEVWDGILCPFGCQPNHGDPIAVTNGQGTTNIDFTLQILLFADGVESNDTSAWSRVVN